MPKKGYRSITIKEYLRKDLAERSKELGLSIPLFLELLSIKYAKHKFKIRFIDGNNKNKDLSNIKLLEEITLDV